MKTIVLYLLRVLDEEAKHLEKTLKLLKEKEKVLIKNDLNKLEKIIASERELFIVFRDIEDSRKSIVQLFAERYGMEEDVCNISRIAEMTDDAFSSKLEESRGKINLLVEKINVQNEKCAALLRKSIELTNFSLKLIAGVARDKETYGRKGIVDNTLSNKKIILDYKA
ncbi:MAG: flagellar protein FlgN [Candidatus Aureabacteria bacterium]|nr:flagellar protein FlgN [Candidatus Auribacterota bacterium]